jgi:hypothetical protein
MDYSTAQKLSLVDLREFGLRLWENWLKRATPILGILPWTAPAFRED